MRRATYDLLGLPPSDQEYNEFAAAYARNADWAVEQLVERLLASPHYGERMAQHWLDVVRYADSADFQMTMSAARHGVTAITWSRAFNQDKPFDRFIEEQIAGDEIDLIIQSYWWLPLFADGAVGTDRYGSRAHRATEILGRCDQ